MDVYVSVTPNTEVLFLNPLCFKSGILLVSRLYQVFLGCQSRFSFYSKHTDVLQPGAYLKT